MAEIEAKLEQMGLVLPEPLKVPAGISIPFSMVIVSGNRAYISGHAPQKSDGSIEEPLGRSVLKSRWNEPRNWRNSSACRCWLA